MTDISIDYIKEINTQAYLKISIGGELFAEVYPCEIAWKIEDGLLDVDQLPEWLRPFYEHLIEQPDLKKYLNG